MLALSFVSHHIDGGWMFMVPLTALFILALGILVFYFLGKSTDGKLLEIFKQLGLLIFAYGAFGTLVGFLDMFDALSRMSELIPMKMISGGVTVALLNVVYGAAYCCIIQLTYIFMKVFNR